MKKVMALLLTMLMVCSLVACGGSKQGNSDFTWTRAGTYEDGNENYLMVAASEDEAYPGWSVMLMVGDEMHGWFIQQEGETLHGNLTSEYEEGADDFIVTISEEDEDGLQMVVEGGETYHFKPMDVPEATIIVHVNTEGIGAIEYAEGEEAPEFDPEHPYQSAQINLAEPTTYTFLATAYEDGWKFVKWTKDGTDYSTDAQITLELAESADYVAVFEYEGQ